jgi:arginase
MTNSTEISNKVTLFEQNCAQAQPTRRIRIIGVPLDMGASRRGVDMGPSAVRVAGLEAPTEATFAWRLPRRNPLATKRRTI